MRAAKSLRIFTIF